MLFFNKKSALQKEYDKLLREEEKFLLKRQEEKENFLNNILSDKIPEKLQSTLDAGFNKAFKLIFQKGARVIEKTYNKEKLNEEFEVKNAVRKIKGSRKSIKAFTKTAKGQRMRNVAASGLSGASLGLLGIGIPDIPLFTSLLLRNVYETAINFGFSYDTEKERFFILSIIEASLSGGEDLKRLDSDLNLFIKYKALPTDYSEEKKIEETSKALSKALLYMKFLQGIPIAGVIGGLYDAVYMKDISSYANLKYRKRYLTDRMK